MKYVKLIFKNVIGIIVVLLFLVLIDYIFLTINYSLTKKNLKEGFDIVGLKDYYVPQGIIFSKKYNVIVQTSYNTKENEAVIFVINSSNGKTLKELKIKYPDNTPYTKMANGIATDEETVWITSDYEIVTLSLNDIVNGSSDMVACTSRNIISVKGDFCYYDNDLLWIGEYAFKPFVKVKHDEPLLMSFTANGNNYDTPTTVITLPNMVRDLIIVDGKFVVSRSFNSLINSDLRFYKVALGNESEYYSVNGKSVPLHHFDKDTIVEEISVPPMAKGIYLDENRYINILSESAAKNNFYSFPKVDTFLRYAVLSDNNQ